MAPGNSKPGGTSLGIGACEMRDRIAGGGLKAVDLAKACIDVIGARDPAIHAFAWFDPEHVMRQASALDAYRMTGRPLGSLHGVPVAVKDVIDTATIPTENGTPIDAGRKPTRDAAVIERLKAAGAVILGKTVSAELAFFHPGPTRNPANPDHTPGGSSSGSAAAVAAGMAPLAIGTQTAGSVIRPAAFCGVTGYKPTFGAISRRGVLQQSPSLDTVGVFAATVADAALLAEVLFGHDAQDKATAPAPHPRLLELARSKAPVAPMFAFVRTPYWNRADAETQAAMEELAAMLGGQCFEADLPKLFAEAPAVRERINLAEMAKCYYAYAEHGGDRLSALMRDAIAAGNRIPARDYISALDWPDVLSAGLDEIFQRCDAILTPAAPGPAPAGLESTGDSIFNGVWTLCGTPTVTLPLFESGSGLPMGLQLVGRRGDDGRLLRTARWLVDAVAAES
ncbi:MAG TPA: amidase [Methylomirabilota bacterium]|nr:amidase [Methylomirabilota bacterium]